MSSGLRALAVYLTLGVQGTLPFNAGLQGPLNITIGPLPASTMPGEVAQTIPVMANFQYLLGLLQQIVPTIPPGPLVQASFVTALDESVPLPQSRRLAAGPNIVISDGGPGGPITIAATGGGGGGGGGGLPRFFGPDPPLNPAAWLDWWNTEEGALKVYYTDVNTAQWVDAMPARTGTPGATSPLTTKGDVWGYSAGDDRIPVGADGDVLTADSTDPLGVSYQTPASPSPLTTKGDLFGFSTLDARLPVGANGEILAADSTQALGLKWIANAVGTVTSVALTMPTGWTVTGSPITSAGTLAITGGPNASFLTLALSADLANERVLTAGANITFTDNGAGSTLVVDAAAGAGSPLTTKGDVYGFSTVNARIPIGSNAQVLTADSTQALGLKWATPTVYATSPLTTKGDLWGFSTLDVRLPIGTNGDVLTADSGQALGLKWLAPTAYAPVGAQYVTLATDATLTSERVLTAGGNITLTDNGAGNTVVIAATGTGGGATAPGICNGRATLETSVPVSTTDQVGKTSVIWTPYNGAQMALYDGASTWTVLGCAETSLAIGTLSAAFQSYDLFSFNNSGTMALELLEWSNATVTMTIASPGVITWTGHAFANGNKMVFTTTGALPTGFVANTEYFIVNQAANTFQLSATPGGTAINTTGSQSGTHTGHGSNVRQTALVLQDGVAVKTGDTTRRHIATIKSTATTTTEDSVTRRFVWNRYNQVPRALANATETTDTWTYPTAAFHQANANLANRLQYVAGDAAVFLDATVITASSATNANNNGYVGIGLNSTVANSAQIMTISGIAGAGATSVRPTTANYKGYPGLGSNSICWLEYASTGTVTFYGDAGTPTIFQAGITGWIMS